MLILKPERFRLCVYTLYVRANRGGNRISVALFVFHQVWRGAGPERERRAWPEEPLGSAAGFKGHQGECWRPSCRSHVEVRRCYWLRMTSSVLLLEQKNKDHPEFYQRAAVISPTVAHCCSNVERSVKFNRWRLWVFVGSILMTPMIYDLNYAWLSVTCT